jgi:plastocyanin
MSSVRLAIVSAFLLFAAGCGGYSSPSSPSSPSPTPAPTPGGTASTVSIARGAETLGNRAYAPDNLSIAAGSTVTWMNTDVVAHTSTSDRSAWDSGIVAPGGQFSFTFQTPGTFTYHCAIHPGMVGTVTVQ